MLGLVKICHQPPALMSAGDMSEVRKSPIVGTSQSTAMKTRAMWTGAFPSIRRILRATPSSTTAGATRTRASATAIRPPA